MINMYIPKVPVNGQDSELPGILFAVDGMSRGIRRPSRAPVKYGVAHSTLFFWRLSSNPCPLPRRSLAEIVNTMWRSPSTSRLLRRAIVGVFTAAPARWQCPGCLLQHRPVQPWAHLCSSVTSPSGSGSSRAGDGEGEVPGSMTLSEAKRLMRLVNVEALKRSLGSEGEDVIGYSKLVGACEAMGLAMNKEAAAAFARVLDESGVVLLFRDMVYLNPDKVLNLVTKAVSPALTPENDPCHDELRQMQKKKEEIDVLAHQQVRRILWSGLGFLFMQIGLFFRLTFWEFSWDVMEPITFFSTTAGILVGYGYFLITSNDPTYQDLMKRLFLSRQRKLFQKKIFDVERFMELQRLCKSQSKP